MESNYLEASIYKITIHILLYGILTPFYEFLQPHFKEKIICNLFYAHTEFAIEVTAYGSCIPIIKFKLS
jgi:hypothetical protein